MAKSSRVVVKAGQYCDTEWAMPYLVTDENGACGQNPDDDDAWWWNCHEKTGHNVNTRWYTGGKSDVYGDVDGQVLEQGKYVISFSCFNPWIGYPLVVFQTGGMGAFAFEQSNNRARLSENEEYSFTYEGYKHTIKRLPDTNYKEFEVWIAVDKS